MKTINIGKYYKEGKIKNVNAWMIYDQGNNKNWFMKDGIKFFSEKPKIFSYFQGYNFKLLNSINSEKIQKYLNHIKEIISDNDEKLYEYILNWFAFILQNPDKKTEIALVLTGEQGTGKNFFTNVLCELLEPYSNRNVSNIDHLVGKFNASIENKKLIICNEMTSADSNKYLNSDALKTLITENRIEINQKNLPIRTAENVCNFIFLSNHFDPIRITRDDRRYVITEVSSKHKQDHEYFEKMFNEFDEDFYNNLFTFFMKRDISKFNVRNIPQTKTKEEILEISKSSYELFYEKFYDEFVEGWNCSEAYSYYKDFAEKNGFANCSVTTFGKNIKQFTEKKRRGGGEREWYYKSKVKIEIKEIDENEEK